MVIVHSVGILLVTLLGFSAGATAVGRGKASPRLLDLLAALASAASVIFWTSDWSRWMALLAAVAIGALAGAGLTAIRPPRAGDASRGRHAAAGQALAGWRWALQEVGNYQGRMTMAFVYFAVLGPFALIARATGDPLVTSGRSAATYWLKRSETEATLPNARKQS